MTYLLTEEDHKALREALEKFDSATSRHGMVWQRKPLAILDKLQRVEVVGHISPHLKTFVREGSFKGDMPINKLFYAVKD